MKYALIVDGYNCGRQYRPYFEKKGVRCLHVQSTFELLCGADKFDNAPLDTENYVENFVYNGDLSALLQQLKPFAICGVIAGSEVGVELADLLCEKLCPQFANGSALSGARRNKFLMSAILQQHGLAAIPSFKSSTVVDIAKWLCTNHIPWPVVLKPAKGAGSEGVFVCNNLAQMQRAFKRNIKKINITNVVNEEVIVQPLIQGEEYIVNTVSYKGKHYHTHIWRSHKKQIHGTFVYDREVLLPLDGAIQQQLQAYVSSVCDALSIHFGASHAEVLLTATGPVLIEIAARVGGAVKVDFINACLGYNDIELVVNSYLDEKLFYEIINQFPFSQLKRGVVVELRSKSIGIISNINFEWIKKLSSLIKLSLNFDKGDLLPKTIDLMTSPGTLYLAHTDQAILEADYELIQQKMASIFDIGK